MSLEEYNKDVMFHEVSDRNGVSWKALGMNTAVPNTVNVESLDGEYVGIIHADNIVAWLRKKDA